MRCIWCKYPAHEVIAGSSFCEECAHTMKKAKVAKPDVVEECTMVAWGACAHSKWSQASEETRDRERRGMRAGIRRYRELIGLEPDPELAE